MCKKCSMIPSKNNYYLHSVITCMDFTSTHAYTQASCTRTVSIRQCQNQKRMEDLA